MKLNSIKSIFIIPLILFVFGMPIYSQEYLSEGNNHYNNGDYKMAIDSYKKAIEFRENPALAWFNMGNAYYQEEASNKAVYCYEASVVEAPDFYRSWVNLGVLCHELKDYGACIAALERAITLKEDDLMVLSVLASAHKELEHFSSAAVYMEKAFELDSTLSDACLMLYDIARNNGDYREALYWLSRYPGTGNRWYEVLLISGEILAEMGDTAGALIKFRQCTRSSPERMQGWFQLVSHLHSMNATYTALIEAEKALLKNQSFISLALLAGHIAFEAEYYDKAEWFFSIAWHAGHPDGAVGMVNMITVYKRYGDNIALDRIYKLMGK
jgi:tetratricopeptide (TPR) repeat protein